MSAPQSTADVSVVGLGRVGLPLALSFADRGLEVVGIDNDPARLDAVREGRMPFAETGAQELLDRVHASGRAVAVRARRRRRARAPHRDHARHAVVLAHRDRHARHPLGARRPAGRARARALADPALDGRAGHDRVRGRLPGQAPRLRDRRGRVRGARSRAHRRRALPGGDRHAAVHHRRRRRPLGRGGGASCSACSTRRSCRPRPCRRSWRRSGRTSCATRTSRCPTC